MCRFATPPKMRRGGGGGGGGGEENKNYRCLSYFESLAGTQVPVEYNDTHLKVNLFEYN